MFFGRKEIRLVVEHKKFSIFDHFGARWCLLVYNSDDRFFFGSPKSPHIVVKKVKDFQNRNAFWDTLVGNANLFQKKSLF